MTSKLVQMQARFQQKQMQEKEEKLLKLYENQQQRAFDKVGRSSAGSTTSLSSTGGGKVRQMFDERRQKAGIDKSYPLEPLKSKSNSRGGVADRKNGVTTKNSVRSVVQNSLSTVKNGKPVLKKKEIIERLYDNDNGKESYEENSFRTGKLYTNGDSQSMKNIDNNVVKKPESKSNTVRTTKSNSGTMNGITNGNKNGNIASKRASLTNDSKRIASNLKNNVSSQKNNKILNTSRNNSHALSMGDKSSVQEVRTPTVHRNSDKQQSPRTVVARDDLNECNYCGRRFAQDRIQKHEEICSKTGKKRRKPYDATKHRVVGTDLETYVMAKVPQRKSLGSTTKNTQRQSVTTSTGHKKDWRRTHEEFISAIRAAKEAQAHIAKGGKLSDLPPPPPSTNPDYVQCPHCNRRFNESAAERHIPKCAEYQFNKPKPGSKSKLPPRK
ncbi:unnamed protein product [Psylliodes chrysocephalus]|uniref:C2HC/C3H-type domain-containing protein n=1 Tax=Psylliodes chrysocephalus TaxID=3402493 RepID=A0A9P0CUU4_9CUCU|nr:unnamed protein product [Psylliodes chrysocephala]